MTIIVDMRCRDKLIWSFFKSSQKIIFVKSADLGVSRRTYCRAHLIAKCFLSIYIFAKTNKTYFKCIYFCARFKNQLFCVFIFVNSNFRVIKRTKAYDMSYFGLICQMICHMSTYLHRYNFSCNTVWVQLLAQLQKYLSECVILIIVIPTYTSYTFHWDLSQ